MTSDVSKYKDKIQKLEQELEQQKGTLWLLGEIMKQSANIESFKQLMSILTDMVMGVMGVTSCYLCIENERRQDYKIFFRSNNQDNKFMETIQQVIPKDLKNLEVIRKFTSEEIKAPILEGMDIPKARLALPLVNFSDNRPFGALVLEHEESDFFTENKIAFFETIAVFAALNARNSKLYQLVSKQANIDVLTGVYNRRCLSDRIEEIESINNVLSVAVIDTDNFKRVNDTLGHLRGDDLLRAISQIAKGYVREFGGNVIRYGGDEFVILLPKPLDESIKIFEDFRNAVTYIPIVYDIKINVTVTIGVCSYPEICMDLEDIVRIADNALIRGKHEGKNRVVIATPIDCKRD